MYTDFKLEHKHFIETNVKDQVRMMKLLITNRNLNKSVVEIMSTNTIDHIDYL